MTEANDIEGRAKIGGWDRHGNLLSACKLLDRMLCCRERNVLRFHVEVERPIAAIATDAGILQTAKWRRQMAHILGIDPDHSGLKPAAEAERARDVRSPYISRQTILRIVGDPQRFGFVPEGDGAQDRAEDLFLRNAHAVGDAREQGRRYVTATAWTCDLFAADRELRAVAPADLDIAKDLL